MLQRKTLLQRKTVGTGDMIGREGALSEVQMTLTGTGTLSATVRLWGTIDEIGKINLGDVVLSGTDMVSVSDSVERMYPVLQAEVIAISGTDAQVTVSMCYDDGEK